MWIVNYPKICKTKLKMHFNFMQEVMIVSQDSILDLFWVILASLKWMENKSKMKFLIYMIIKKLFH